jgi:SAM-dependent methyltransferase
MDRPDNDPVLLEQALEDLAWSHRRMGGLRTLRRALDPWLCDPRIPPRCDVLDVGSGGADLSRAMVEHARALDRELRVVAVDRDPTVVAFAGRSLRPPDGIALVRADAFALPFRPRSFDLVIASLFLHHFRAEEVVVLLRSFLALARRAVIVSDLHRHRLPWLFLQVAGRVAGRGPMFVHDAPLSVLRAFTPGELLDAARAAGSEGARVARCWPFRLVLTAPVSGAQPR